MSASLRIEHVDMLRPVIVAIVTAGTYGWRLHVGFLLQWLRNFTSWLALFSWLCFARGDQAMWDIYFSKAFFWRSLSASQKKKSQIEKSSSSDGTFPVPSRRRWSDMKWSLSTSPWRNCTAEWLARALILLEVDSCIRCYWRAKLALHTSLHSSSITLVAAACPVFPKVQKVI